MSLASGKKLRSQRPLFTKVFPSKTPNQPRTTQFPELLIEDEVFLPNFGEVEPLHISEVAVSSEKCDLGICDL